MNMRIFAWYALLVAIACVTVSAQLDRQSARTPSLALITPEPFRGFAQGQIAANAIASSSPETALVHAQRLVARRPMPAETLRILAQAQFAAGQYDRALATIQTAAKRGWRDAPSQEIMLRLAAGAGDHPEAARRFLALLLNNSSDDALLIQLSGDVFAEGENAAVDQLGTIVAASPRWQSTFLRRAFRVVPPDILESIIVDAIGKGARFDCNLLRTTLEQISQGDGDVAADEDLLSRSQCRIPV